MNDTGRLGKLRAKLQCSSIAAVRIKVGYPVAGSPGKLGPCSFVYSVARGLKLGALAKELSTGTSAFISHTKRKVEAVKCLLLSDRNQSHGGCRDATLARTRRRETARRKMVALGQDFMCLLGHAARCSCMPTDCTVHSRETSMETMSPCARRLRAIGTWSGPGPSLQAVIGPQNTKTLAYIVGVCTGLCSLLAIVNSATFFTLRSSPGFKNNDETK